MPWFLSYSDKDLACRHLISFPELAKKHPKKPIYISFNGKS